MDEESTKALLARSLETAGLEPSYWSPILANKLGVISVQGLRYVGEECYAILRPFARHLEETKVIIKFLKVTNGESHQMQREEQRKKLEIRQEEYQQMLQHLKKVQRERKDKEVQQIERNMFELLQMPPEYCLSKNMNLNEVRSQLETFHENIRNALNEADRDATYLIQSSSGGLALRGILLTGERNDQFQERDFLLKVPTNIELMQPSYAEHEIIKVFITNEEEDQFNTTTEMLGYSVTAISSSGFWKSTSEDALSLYNAEEKNGDYMDDPESTYCCTVKYFIVPLASYCFKNSVIQLSDNAVKYLKRIEKLALSKSRSLQMECEKFFRKFGSHANRGPLNFGGSYQWKSYSSDFKQKSLAAIKKLQREAINFQIPLSADTAVSVVEYKSEFIWKYPEVLMKKTFLEITRNGGPQEAVGLPDWKNGLIASSDTWSVVDRGTTLVPVWEIIELCHATDFQNSSDLAKVMKQAMETMSPSHHEVKECTEAIEINEMIKEWNENEDMYSSEDQLVKLVEKKQQLARNSLNPNAWPIYCLSQQLLQKFLRLVIDKHFQHDLGRSKQSEHIKHYVSQLIEPTDLDIVEDFPDRQHFCRLLYATEKPNVPLNGDNFLSVEAYFHYTLDYMYAGMPRSKKSIPEIANEPGISIRVTAIVAKNVFLLRKHLQRTKQYYEELFIVTILLPFNYDPDSYTFLTLISVCDIEYLCSEYGSYCTQFFKVLTSKHLTKKNLQVYILSMAMEVCEVMDVMEVQRKHLVGYIEHNVGDDIDPSIAKTMQRLNSMKYDWKWFHDEIKALISDVSLLPKESRQLEKTVAIQRGYASHSIPKPIAERVASQSVSSLIKAMEPPHKAVSVQRQRTSPFKYQATEQHPLAQNIPNEEQCVQRPRNGSFTQSKLTSTSDQELHSISKKSLPKPALRLPAVPPRPISPRPLSLPRPVSPRPVLPVPPKTKSSKRGGTPLKLPTQMQQEDQTLQSRGASSLGEAVEPTSRSFFFKLGLTKYCPQGLTVQNSLEIREDTINTMNSFEQSKGHGAKSTQHKFMDPKLYPFLILQSVMAFDYKCRIKLTVQTDKSKMGGNESSGIDLSEFGLDDEADKETIHPMDGVLALLHCADNFLRQDLISRMTICQLAIPLLLPDPFTGNLIFPLWAMRSIVKEWKGTKSLHANEGPLVSHPAPLVSFLRIGTHRHSKSRTLNTIINDSGHDWFFHYNCDGGNAKQLLVNGLAEVCWYLPSATDSVFPDVVTFANLHGDARELQKQVNFLSEISLMNFVLLNVTELADERSSRVLQSLAKAPGGLILLVAIPTELDNTAWKGQLKEVLASLPKGKCNIIMLDKNEADIRDKVRHKINDKITIPGIKHCVLEECTKIAHKYGITTDEDGKDCVKGKELAYKLKDIIHKHSRPEKSAKELLPLQGSQLWHEWSKHDKEQYRQFDRKQESPDIYAAEQRSKMQAIRQKQCSTTPSKLMKTFLENVVLHQGSVRWYFLQWLKMILDNLSRKQLAQLHSQYQRKKQELHDLQKKHQKTLEKLKKERNEVGKEQQKKKFKETELVCKKELKKLNEKIIDSSFGLEHLLREIGQIYEAVRTETDVKGHIPPNEKQILDLPRVAAELLIDSHPLELMDGDAAHVPGTWILAVLEQIQNILKNPRVLVLSIVGLQSTGKSTLMNTVFGLRFSVSAGRCTRGAFMQLVPIHSSLRQECKCDYFLIVDTEGLRAPELDALSTQKHDNELATFVIGLANITIVNIAGEVAGDIEDILQTAVHAFLRMNKVNLTPGCHFVHHNVTAVMAGEKGAVGRSKFKQKLDEMTQLAAKEEHLEGDYDSFSQVIKFDDEKDVTHFPGLWKGDPPMAPVNPGYCSKAQGLKFHFISLAKSNQRSMVQLSIFINHLKQLWKAILHENFVFSFKNTFEFVAYNALDTEYGKWSWKLQEAMMKWEQQTQNKLGSCIKPDQLSTVYGECKTDLSIFVLKRYENAEKEMKEYFRTSDKKEIIKQWEVRTTERLKDLQRQLKVHAEEHCEQLFKSQEALDDVRAKKDDHRARIVEHVKQMASQLEKRQLNDQELEKMFDDEWRKWMKKLKDKEPGRHRQVNVLSMVQKSLTESEIIKTCNAVLLHKIGETPLQYWGTQLALRINETHLVVESGGWFRKKPTANVQAAQIVTDNIFRKVREYLNQKRSETFHPSLTVKLISIVYQGIENAYSNKFPFTQEYVADMALTACGYALRVFQQMVEDQRKKNDPVEYMEREMRKPLLSLFKDLYRQIAQEKIVARNLCALLHNPVKKQVMSSLSPKIVSYIVTEFPWIQTKPALK